MNKEPDPKWLTFAVYGDFSYGKENLNVFLVRVPFSLNWHKRTVPACGRVVRKIAGKRGHAWYVDGWDDIDRMWNNKKSKFRKFYWRGNRLVEKHN